MAYSYKYDEEEKTVKPRKLQTNRNAIKLILLNIITLGIYGIIFFIPFSNDIDKIAARHDGTKTPNYLFAFLLSLFTFQIVLLIWHYNIADRIDAALTERNIPYNFGTGTFWTWMFFGSFILIGPCVYYFKLCKAMNLLCEDYNKKLDA